MDIGIDWFLRGCERKVEMMIPYGIIEWCLAADHEGSQRGWLMFSDRRNPLTFMEPLVRGRDELRERFETSGRVGDAWTVSPEPT